MRFIPLLFQPVMALRSYSGLKTVTRRTSALEIINKNPDDWKYSPDEKDMHGNYMFIQLSTVSDQSEISSCERIKCPYGKVNDVLWVRENWTQNGLGYYRYQADWPQGKGPFTEESVPKRFRGKWKPNIHMPFEACRTFLQVIDIKPSRLHDMSEQEAMCEGVTFDEDSGYYFVGDSIMEQSALDAFMNLWISINGEDNWLLNPWVWRIEFKKVELPTFHYDERRRLGIGLSKYSILTGLSTRILESMEKKLELTNRV